MTGSVIVWNGVSGRLLELDHGDKNYTFAAADVSGSISVGMVVAFDADGMTILNGYSKAKNVTQYVGQKIT